MIADLMGPPLLLRPWEVGRLTDCQILDYYHHARDKEGRIEVPREARPAKTPEDARWYAEQMARAFGVTIDGEPDDAATPG